MNMTRPVIHWRSTMLGLCIFGLALKGSLHFSEAGAFAMTTRDWFGVFFGLCAAGIGAFQKDPGTEVVQAPDGTQKADSSTETPDSGLPVVKS